MKHQLGRALRVLLTVAIVALLVLFARRVNWIETWHALSSASPTMLLAALLVNLVSLVLKGVRWWVFLRPVGAPSLSLALKATFAGAGLNNVLVANGGEAARVVFVARAAHIESAKVLATLALERMFELIGYIVLLALSVSFLGLPPVLERTRPIAWLALAGVVALMIYLVRRPKLPEFPAPPAGDGWRAKVAAYLKHFGQTIGGISTRSESRQHDHLGNAQWHYGKYDVDRATNSVEHHHGVAGKRDAKRSLFGHPYRQRWYHALHLVGCEWSASGVDAEQWHRGYLWNTHYRRHLQLHCSGSRFEQSGADCHKGP